MMTPSMIQTCLALKGRYHVQRIKADSGLIIQSSPWMTNLITNVGKDKYFAGAYYADLYGAVGTGNSTPDASNTALDNPLHMKYADEVNAVPSTFTESGGTVKSIFRYRFNPGEATGNISELGIYIGYGSGNRLFSRALVRDSQGNPATITVLSDEYLDVYWEFTLEVAGRTTGTLPLYHADGTTSTVDWVMKPAATPHWKAHVHAFILALPEVRGDGYYSHIYANVDNEPGHEQDIPQGHSHGPYPNYGAALPYVDGSYYRDYEFVWLLDRANMSGINCFRLYIGPGHLWLYLPNHHFEKTAMDKLSVRFRLSIT